MKVTEYTNLNTICKLARENNKEVTITFTESGHTKVYYDKNILLNEEGNSVTMEYMPIDYILPDSITETVQKIKTIMEKEGLELNQLYALLKNENNKDN